MGEIVAGRFRLVRPVESGMGRVWHARDEVLRRNVALKEVVPDPAARARTINEARASAQLAHPNVVYVYDVLSTGDQLWVVMELVDGRSLEATVSVDGPLAAPDAARVGLAVLDWLDAVHRAGVVHHPVDPRKVLLADDGRILLNYLSEPGSRQYLAPEYTVGLAPTARSDLWSLGATLYWTVEGQAPFAFGPRRHEGPLAKVIDGLMRTRPAERLTSREARALLKRAARIPAEPAAHRRVVTGAAVAALVLAGTGTALAVARPAPRTAVAAAPAAPSLTCAAAVDPLVAPAREPTAGTPISPGTSTSAQATWARALDDGFSVEVPRTWVRNTAGTAVCLLDPTGRRAVAIDRAASADPDRVTYWQRAEATLLAGNAPAGYERVDISPALFKRGGADWEYRYASDGVRWHVLRRAFASDAGQPYVISWITADDEWDRDQPDFRMVMRTFESR